MLYLYQKRLDLNDSERQINTRAVRRKLKLRFIAPAQEAKNAAPLSSIFGQFGISCIDFCKQFNEESVRYTAGLVVIVYLDMADDRSFKFTIKEIFFSEFLLSIAEDNAICMLDFFRLIHVYSTAYKLPFWSSTKTLLGTLKATRVGVITN